METNLSSHSSLSARYKEALDFLFAQLPMFSRVGAAAYKPGLDTSLALDAYFGHPHRHFKSIHIGGTNGKGSTSHTIAAILQAQGYRTGLYTSPHLVDFRERMRVNGEMIPMEEVVDFVDRWRACNYDGSPSFFELTMMMAFDWFARKEVDYAVIEVGMGGRLDSTNIITPIAAVITNISPDHTQFLGSNLPAIASEKAGIIKSGIPVVIGESEGDVRNVFTEKAALQGASIRYADEENLLSSASAMAEGGWRCSSSILDDFTFALAGEYQKKNLNTILSAIDMLREAGVEISDESLRRGLADVEKLTGLRGRWTRLATSPLSICDTGHNEAGLSYNIAQLRHLMQDRPSGKLRMIMGFVADKAIDHILSLLPREANYYITNADIPRALPREVLFEKAKAAGLVCELCDTPYNAYIKAMADASPSDIIYTGGSTFVVADLLAKLDQ